MAGFIAGFDHDTRESIEEMADRIMEIGIDVPFLSVMTPFRGTPVYHELLAKDRMLEKGIFSNLFSEAHREGTADLAARGPVSFPVYE